MASASDHPQSAAPAPSVSGPKSTGTGIGTSAAAAANAAGHLPRAVSGTEKAASSSSSFSPLLPTAHGITASSSTSAQAGSPSALAQIVSDFAAHSGSGSHLPSTAAANGNSTTWASHNSPVHPSTPVTSTHAAVAKGSTNNTNGGRWPPLDSQKHLASTSSASLPIVEPTTATATASASGKPSPAPRKSIGFPSPKGEAMRTNQKYLDDCARLMYGVQQALPEAARRAVRDNWEKCLLGSDFHQAFVLNASIHHARPAAIQRGIRDFGKDLIVNAKTQIVQQMTTDDLDQLADLILSKASVAFFDKALEQRLRTIDAKRLINALARAERLGYEISDVQDEDVDGASVPSAIQSLPQAQAQAQEPPPAISSLPNPVPPTSQSGSVLHCTICFRRFPAQSAFDHHVKGRVCTRTPTTPGGFKYNCQYCGQAFTDATGLQYHNANKVCGDFGEPAKAKLVKDPAVPSPGSGPAPLLSTPHPGLTIPARLLKYTSSSNHPSASKSTSLAPIPARNPSLNNEDPYAHLSPEQKTCLQSELREAEIKFTERMRQAHLLPNPTERDAKLDGLANSFATRQSLIRKKYGVRLRKRRNKDEIEQQRNRMQYKTAAEVQADLGVTRTGFVRPITSSPSADQPQVDSGTASGSRWAPVLQPTPTAMLVKDPGDVNMHGTKRRFNGDEASGSKRIAYADMGGLSGTKAEAETRDPTLLSGVGTRDKPMALDDSSSSSESNSNSGDSADEDIPAVLPASVKQSLLRSSPASGEVHSRPSSSSRAGPSSAAAAAAPAAGI